MIINKRKLRMSVREWVWPVIAMIVLFGMFAIVGTMEFNSLPK